MKELEKEVGDVKKWREERRTIHDIHLIMLRSPD